MGQVAQIKNIVFRRLKLGHTIINSTEDSSKAANQFIPSITTLFQKRDVILNEPYDVEEALIIPGFSIFFFLLNSKEPCCTRKYASKKNCGHVDYDFDSLTQCRST